LSPRSALSPTVPTFESLVRRGGRSHSAFTAGRFSVFSPLGPVVPQVVETIPIKEKPVLAKDAPRKNPSAPSKATTGPKGEKTEKRPAVKAEGERPPRRTKDSKVGTVGERADRGDKGTIGDKPPRKERDPRDSKEPKGPIDPSRINKRSYERKSGTGRGKEMKKSGGGKRNWGKDGEINNWDSPTTEETVEAPEETKVEDGTTKSAEVTPEPTPPPVKVETEDEKKTREEEEKEQKRMTFDDYMKKKQEEKLEKASIIPELPAPRKAGEGVDKKELQKWAKFAVLKREEEENVEEKSIDSENENKKDKKAKREVVAVDSIFRVRAQPRPKQGFRDRKDFNNKDADSQGTAPPPRKEIKKYDDNQRGGRRKQGPTGGSFNVEDTSSFPALSTPTTKA